MEGATFLGALKGTWDDHKTCMSKLKDVLSYLVSYTFRWMWPRS